MVFAHLLVSSWLPSSFLGADWPQFRGANRDNISTETGLFRTWPAGGPKVLWKIPVCEGYAGAAIKDGRIYLNDYDAEKKEHLVRCLSIADGKDIWQWSYPVEVRPNHGITRTVSCDRARGWFFPLDPEMPLPCPRHQDGQAGLAEKPRPGLQGYDPGMVCRPESAPRRRSRGAGDRRRCPGGCLRSGNRQGDLALAESRQGPDVALLAHARNDRRRQAISVHDARTR